MDFSAPNLRPAPAAPAPARTPRPGARAAPAAFVGASALLVLRLAAFVAAAFLVGPLAAQSRSSGTEPKREPRVEPAAITGETAVKRAHARRLIAAATLVTGFTGALVTGCGGSDDDPAPVSVAVDAGTDATDALVADITVARIAGGIHFRSSVVDGAALGKNVADRALAHRFQAR